MTEHTWVRLSSGFTGSDDAPVQILFERRPNGGVTFMNECASGPISHAHQRRVMLPGAPVRPHYRARSDRHRKTCKSSAFLATISYALDLSQRC